MKNVLKHKPRITKRKFDYIEMVGIIFGDCIKNFWLFLMVATQTGACVGYASVFASSMAAVVPTVVYPTCDIYASEAFITDCRFVYWFWLALFYFAMMYYCIRGLTEQTWMQVVMAMMRYGIVLCLLITSILEITGITDNWEGGYDNGVTPKSVNWSALGIMVPMICFSL